MDIDWDSRRARMGVGEFADFTLGPRDGGEGPAGVWRAQLGSHWHRELQARTAADGARAEFEVPIEGALPIRGWSVQLGGRVDQLLRDASGVLVREVKTVTRPLPEGDDVLRADYPAYFVQLAAYVALLAGAGTAAPVRGELAFVETGTGFTQAVPLTAADRSLLTVQLERVGEFLELRRRARDRLRGLRYVSPFREPRPGQSDCVRELAAAAARGLPLVLEAPTGFGKTGVLLEFALGAMREGRFERLLYLTGKATGQIQVVRTLETMAGSGSGGGPTVWAVRPKAEHCINHAFHCVREDCIYLDQLEARWPTSGLARFYLFEGQPRDLPALREAGRDARICPYEITRASLPFNDVWIGDYNYVFSPGSRGIFYRQPGFEPGRSLLIVDEAHNLPSRAADAHSFAFTAAQARETALLLGVNRPRADLLTAWSEWTEFLEGLEPSAALPAGAMADARDLISRIAEFIRTEPIDFASLSPVATECLWRMPPLADALAEDGLARLWWCRRPGELSLTCLDAAPAIGSALREFGGVILATATPGPLGAFAQALGVAEPPDPARPELAGLDAGRLGGLTKRETRRLTGQVFSGAQLLRQAYPGDHAIVAVHGRTPWRDGAYSIGFDARADTRFQHRSRDAGLTAGAVAAMAEAARACIAVFFPSYAYAELILSELAAAKPALRASIQPRSLDLAAQTEWVMGSLAQSDALFLILGSGFSESIDLLGGRVTHGIVVGPALPEVNAVQQARLAALASEGREAAFRRVYQIPGMQKVNQAIGRLVRAPGHRAKILLHCRRFAEAAYRNLLAEDYQNGTRIETDEEFEAWLAGNQSAP